MWLYLLGLVLLLCYVEYRRRIQKFLVVDKMFPGPLALPIFGNSIQFFFKRHVIFEFGREFLLFYRRSVRLWMMTQLFVIVVDGPDVEKVIGTHEHSQKAQLYDNFLDWLGQGLLTSYGDKWKRMRKILTPAFHFSILENFLEIFHRNQTILLQKLGETRGVNFDVFELIKLYALDNICETAMGTKVDAQLNPKSEYVTSIKNMVEIVLTRTLSPWLWPNFLFSLTTHGAKSRKSLKVIHGLTQKVIAQRREELRNSRNLPKQEDDIGLKKKHMFLDILLQSEEEGGLTDEEIQHEVDTFMFEGHDTISSAISFALYNLSQYPKYQDAVYKEIYEIFGDDQRAPTLQDLQNMKYMELIIKETLRLYPSVPAIARVIKKDVVLDDHATLPEGTTAIVIVQATHRHPRYWEKPDDFHPAHFEPEAVAKRHPFQYIPFSAGPRNCIGQRFAMLEMKSTLSRILRDFQLLPADPHVPVQLNFELIAASKTGMNVRIVPRKK